MRKMKPILFNLPMLRAVDSEIKTETRRIAFAAQELRHHRTEQHPEGWWFKGRIYRSWHSAINGTPGLLSHCKYSIGDVLYVRESFGYASALLGGEEGPVYRMDYSDTELAMLAEKGWKWRPSLHMPKELARTFLRVTDVRLEPLQNIIFEPHAVSCEGCENDKAFIAVWNSTVPKADRLSYSFEANPWVWVIRFKKISRKEAFRAATL